MCLALPMKIVEVVDETRGIVDLGGVRYEANLSLLDDPRVGQHVIVHAGFAIETLDEEEAEVRLALFEKMADLHSKQSGRETRPLAPDRKSRNGEIP